jgi:F-type H+-transporting ATPase subunit gamma
MANTKDIQRRIKSVNSTKKITRAMEMVAAAKMRKAIEAVLRTRTYANLSWITVLNLSSSLNVEHPLLSKGKEKSQKRVAVVLISSNRGLCGGYNTNIINKAHQSIVKNQAEGVETDFIIIGKKGAKIRKYYGYNIKAEFPKDDAISEVKEVYSVTKLIVDSFLDGTYDKIMLAYTDFVNATKQIPRVKQLLPVDVEAEDNELGVVGSDTRVGMTKEFAEEKAGQHLNNTKYSYEYIFEPSPKEVLDEMVPRLIEVQLFQALLEANASEHSARMTAMHQANDAAGDLVADLTLYYNKARQASITNEIAEIAAGAEALVDK